LTNKINLPKIKLTKRDFTFVSIYQKPHRDLFPIYWHTLFDANLCIILSVMLVL